MTRRFHSSKLHCFLLSHVIGTIRLYVPTNSEHVSCSILSNGMSSNYIEVNSINYDRLLEMVYPTDEFILKLDVEGAEIEILESLYTSEVHLPAQLLVEYDCLRSINISSILRYWRSLVSLNVSL